MAVRSLQRYEHDLDMPIHRPAGKRRGTVIAVRAELDAWVTSATGKNGPRHPYAVHEKTNRLGADFLRIDSEVALTFSGLALTTYKEQDRKCATEIARKAYATIIRLREKVELTEAQRDNLDANLQRLKNELQSLGQNVEK